ncbi:MAG: GWxTD domain-containing protein [Ignavibacteria bacterium]|nr:GWxTD domain-containing protein [Ignavibacteria bacterium]HRJ85612.1 GWxTD domain-containing protein [Ignavibacteria bacterium]
MFKRINQIIILITLFSTAIFSQNELSFDYDYAIFRDEGSKVFLELYYSFSPQEMKFVQVAGGFEASGKLQLDVLNKGTGQTIVAKDFRIPVTLTDTSGSTKDFKLTGQLNLLLDSGTYTVKMNASDFNNPSKTSFVEEEIVLKPFPLNKVIMSTIELGTSIVKSTDENNIFYKNTLEVTPNPSNLFGNNISKLYYYLELYNLNNAELGDKYSIVTTVNSKDGTELSSSVKKYDLKSESKVEYGSVDISGLPSNSYQLFVKLLDSGDSEILRAYKYFYVFSSDTGTGSQNLTDLENQYLLSEYPKLTEKQVDDEFNKAIYLMSDQQKNKYETLKSTDEKRMYMFNYWRGIAAYITKKEYLARIDFANKNFKSDLREGWKTDRGRITAIYGKYDEIERFPYEGSTRAYEIWTYNKLQGGAVFVFIDNSSGFGDYILAHSTAQNEIRDDNWRDRINIR